MTETIMIALDKLDLDPKNVRKTMTSEGIEEMAASLLATGQIQNIVVRPSDKKNHYLVTAGARRWAGFKLLAANGDCKKNHAVRCIVRTEEEATEISLAENSVRSDMHPADAFEAFSKLAEQGMPVADIAARFGVSETIIRQRLALGRVSPVLMQLFRDEEISFEALKAFTVTDDHGDQERVWNELPSYQRDAYYIRRSLTTGAASSNERRLVFLGGIETYEAAGGAVKRDLFDARDNGYALDIALLDRLVAEKLEGIAVEVKGEGWSNVKIIADYNYDYGAFEGLERHHREMAPMTEAEETEREALSQEYDNLSDLIEKQGADDAAEARVEAIEKRIEELSNREALYPAHVIESGTAFVLLDQYGRVKIERGFCPVDEDTATQSGIEAKSHGGTASPEQKNAEIVYSATLIESLTAQKTAILRAEMMNNSHVALASVVHTLLVQTAPYFRSAEHSCLRIRLQSEPLAKRVELTGDSLALQEIDGRENQIGERIPGEPSALWDWCLEQSTDQLLDLLAFAAAKSINVVVLKHEQNTGGAAHGNRLAEALNINMNDWYAPTAESCFQHLNRASIELAMQEAAGDQAQLAVKSAAKKTEATIIAERLVKDIGWLPKYIRIQTATPVAAASISIDDIDYDDVDDNDNADGDDEFAEAAE